jgi:hypothetical protein
MARPGTLAFAAAATLAVAATASPARAEAPPRFPATAVWHQDISQAAVHADSASMISTLQGLGGFGNGRMQIDFGMRIVRAPAGAPTRNIVGYPSGGEYYSPDCEAPGTAMPVPANAAIEASAGLSCANASNDCHLLVVQGSTLYEAYRANASGDTGLQSQCLAKWNLDAVYPASNRGEHCTSADAAGFPIAPLLFNADEVHAAMQVPAGDLGHAIRFILPNARMASSGGTRYYVRPASHAGGPTGPVGSVPYGSRLRLRANFPVNLYNPAAQVILRTMQRYGIVLADGGTVALTAEADLYTTHKWTELGIDSRTFDLQVAGAPVRVQDFQVLDTGPRIVETYDCVRNAEPPPVGGGATVSIADAAVAEGNAGTTPMSFALSLSAAQPAAVSVDVATSNGSASAGSDYAAASSTVSIPAGATSASFVVQVSGDTSVEGDEQFSVALSNPAGATIADGQATGTIVNDDVALPTLGIADASTTEGRRGTKLLVFTVRLSAPAVVPVSYDIRTADIVASNERDYIGLALVGEVIPAGATSRTFSVQIRGETLPEPDETFSVTVSNVAGASVADGYAVGTIVNDDKK